MKLNRSRRKSGFATAEAVIALGVSMPLAILMLAFGLKLCKATYHLVASLTCWPYM